jgi:hypothetical protein
VRAPGPISDLGQLFQRRLEVFMHTDRELRMKCLELATRHIGGDSVDQIVLAAQRFYDFAMAGQAAQISVDGDDEIPF